jgi:hypothetical protein
MACALERLKPPVIKSIRSSLNRRLGGVLSTGFTRAILICGNIAVVALVARKVSDFCACATSDHAAATPTNRVMNSRRFTRSPRRRGLQRPRSGSRSTRSTCGDAPEIAVAEFAHSPNGGLILTASGLATLHRDLIITLAVRHKLPAVYFERSFVAAGGLVSYGPDFVDQYLPVPGADQVRTRHQPQDREGARPCAHYMLNRHRRLE